MTHPNGKRFYTEKQAQEIADDLEKAVTIPVNALIEAEHRVYDFSEVEKILREAERIIVQDCGCKTAYRNCDSPREVCLSLDQEAEYALDQTSTAREITIKEAIEVLERSHEAGLVHMAYVMKGEEKPGLICSCCSCCCHTLGGLLRYGIHTEILNSNMIALDDPERCNECGECVERCHFNARSVADQVYNYDNERCYGCGLCVRACQRDAIKMLHRETK